MKIRRKTTREIGNNFHDRVEKLIQKMGLEILESDYNQEGPDIIAIDPESKKETKLLIQCKKSQSNKTYPSLQGLVDEYSAKVHRYKATRSLLCLSGFKLRKKFDFKQTLSESKVAVLDEGLLGYYEDLQKKIGQFSKYQFLSDMGVFVEFNELKKVKAIEVTQNNTTFYVFSISPEWLLKTSRVTRRVSLGGSINGYQRLLNKKRVTSTIPDFLRKEEWVLPNSIIAVLDSNKTLDFQKGVLNLPSRYGLMWVMDGQHRLYSFANVDELARRRNEIVCVAFDGSTMGRESEIKQAQIFVDLNSHAKKVDRSLLLELGNVLGNDDPALNAITKLSSLALFKGLVRGYSSGDGMIKLATFATNSGIRSIVEYYRKTGKYKTSNELTKVTYIALLSFFKAVQSIFKKEWGSRDFIITDNRGIRALLKVCLKILQTNSGRMDIASTKKDLKHLRSIWNSTRSFKVKDLKGLYLGEGGANKLSGEWLQTMAERNKILHDSEQLRVNEEMVRGIIEEGETKVVEFKSSFFWDTRENRQREELRQEILKTICAFLNTQGGTLLVGVSDDGSLLGLDGDFSIIGGSRIQNKKDELRRKIVSFVSSQISPGGRSVVSTNVDIRFLDISEKNICVISVKRYGKPLYAGQREDFYIRNDSSSIILKSQEMIAYIRENFNQ